MIKHSQQRRRLLQAAVVIAAAPSVVACASSTGASPFRFGTLDEALGSIDRTISMLAATQIDYQNTWSFAQMLEHLAQSIEYSITGFPSHKSDLFKSTVGSAAFTVFGWRGKMSHSLNEPIPGAPTLSMQAIDQAAQRLKQAITQYKSHQGVLQSHFAYGQLDREQYTRAHLFHINNHFEQIKAKT